MPFFPPAQAALSARLIPADLSSQQIQKCLNEVLQIRRNLRCTNSTWKGFYGSLVGLTVFLVLTAIATYYQITNTQNYNRHALPSNDKLKCADQQKLTFALTSIDSTRFNATADYLECNKASAPAILFTNINFYFIFCLIIAAVALCITHRDKGQFSAYVDLFENQETLETLQSLGIDLNAENYTLDQLVDELKQLKQKKVTEEHEFEVEPGAARLESL